MTTTPADTLRTAAERARQIGDPLHLALAGWLERAADASDCHGLGDGGIVATLVHPALAVARQIPGTTTAPADQTAEAHRLALSEALGLGTSAPWDAIRDRATELHEASEDWSMPDARPGTTDYTRQQQPTPAVARQILGTTAEQSEAEDESCGRFVPDTPRAPGLCASCGDARGWHSRMAVLPAPVDRAAVLREAANGLAALGPLDNLVSAPAAWTEAIETLRHMADQIAEDDRRRLTDEAAAGVQQPAAPAATGDQS
ncbi:hypothetical protein AB0L71_28215 [Streptomyces sp. NPDC052052]|uniref:hypothetical protein n=1 Tax=Streptomyces sp. NPDC052052 TaxID=3154756 RepID=UPI0034267295